VAEQLVYSSEKALKEAGEKVPGELRKSIEDKISDLKRVKDAATPDLTAMKTATEALNAEIQKIGQYMSQNSGGNQSAGGQNAGANQQSGNNSSNGGNDGGEGNVKDAEFKEKK